MSLVSKKRLIFSVYSITHWASVVAQLVKNPPAMQETCVQSPGWKDPLEEGIATHSSILAWRMHGLYRPWDHTESGTTEWLKVSDSLWLHGLQSTRLLCPWDFPGKNVGVVCHFLLKGGFLTPGLNLHCKQILYWPSCQGSPPPPKQTISRAVLSCSVISDSSWPVDCSPPGSSVHGGSPGKSTGVGCRALLQRIFTTQGWTPVSCIEGGFFTSWAIREALPLSWFLFISLAIPLWISRVAYSTRSMVDF